MFGRCLADVIEMSVTTTHFDQVGPKTHLLWLILVECFLYCWLRLIYYTANCFLTVLLGVAVLGWLAVQSIMLLQAV